MVTLGPAEDFQIHPLTPANVDGVSVVVVYVQGILRVIENRCPHQQANLLHEGTIESNGLTCPLHGRTFDLKDGTCRNGAGKLSFLETEVRDGILWVAPLPPPSFSAF
jgi:nitrite reductase (NADH) small subunit